MKIATVILLLFMPAIVIAQTYPGMNQADIQKMQEMQACMGKVDQGKMKSLEQRQKQFDAEMKSLCHSGKRDQAQKKAISYAKEMSNNLTIQQIKKCSEIAKGMMPEMDFTKQNEEFSRQHVCDSY